MITHTIDQFKARQSYKFKEFAKTSNVLILKKLYTQHTF